MVELPTTFVLVFPLAYGLIVSVLEMIFVHADEHGLGWIGHGLHAVPWCVIFTYASMNVPAVLNLIPMDIPMWLANIVIPLALGIITAFKVKAAAAIAKGGTVGEKLWHAIVIGALVALAPFIYALLGPLPLPEFLMR